MNVKILDQQRRVVADLGTYLAAGVISGAILPSGRFVPELDRVFLIRDNLGTGLGFRGTSSDGQPLPNGFYRVIVQQGSGAAIEVTFYLEHQAWNGGDVIAVLPPRASEALFRWNYGEVVNIRFDLYNLPGELVWQGRATAQSGDLHYALQSTSGQPIAAGIYVLKVQASSLDGAVDDLRFFKLAVVR